MTLEDLWEVARAHVPAGVHWGVSQSIGQDGGGTAGVQVHGAGWIERSIYLWDWSRGGAARVLALVALAVIEGRWQVHAPPPPPVPAPISPQEAA